MLDLNLNVLRSMLRFGSTAQHPRQQREAQGRQVVKSRIGRAGCGYSNKPNTKTHAHDIPSVPKRRGAILPWGLPSKMHLRLACVGISVMCWSTT